MSAQQFNQPDTAALLTVLGQAMELCRKLDLPKNISLFEGFIARLQKEPLIDEVFRDEVSGVVNGIAAFRILSKLGGNSSELNRLQNAFSRVLFPEIPETEKQGRRQKRKTVRGSEISWQLDGESDLSVAIIPQPPKAGAATTIRLTHSNSYGPYDEVEFFVRVGDPAKPTAQDDLESASDWVKARLVEELVFVGDKEMLRSEAEEPFEDETPWDGTYEAQLIFPAGRQSIEIKVMSRQPELLRSLVLSNWEISAH